MIAARVLFVAVCLLAAPANAIPTLSYSLALEGDLKGTAGLLASPASGTDTPRGLAIAASSFTFLSSLSPDILLGRTSGSPVLVDPNSWDLLGFGINGGGSIDNGSQSGIGGGLPTVGYRRDFLTLHDDGTWLLASQCVRSCPPGPVPPARRGTWTATNSSLPIPEPSSLLVCMAALACSVRWYSSSAYLR